MLRDNLKLVIQLHDHRNGLYSHNGWGTKEDNIFKLLKSPYRKYSAEPLSGINSDIKSLICFYIISNSLCLAFHELKNKNNLHNN